MYDTFDMTSGVFIYNVIYIYIYTHMYVVLTGKDIFLLCLFYSVDILYTGIIIHVACTVQHYDSINLVPMSTVI